MTRPHALIHVTWMLSRFLDDAHQHICCRFWTAGRPPAVDHIFRSIRTRSRRSRSASRLPPPATCTLAAPARRCSTGCTPARCGTPGDGTYRSAVTVIVLTATGFLHRCSNTPLHLLLDCGPSCRARLLRAITQCVPCKPHSNLRPGRRPQTGGAFVLRVEDTDAARSTRASEEAMVRDLKWLGLDWDEGETRRRAALHWWSLLQWCQRCFGGCA